MTAAVSRRLSLLGSTGSIGHSTLDVVRAHPDRLSVAGLAANTNWRKLLRQIEEFRPALVALHSEEAAERLREALGGRPAPAVRSGMAGLLEVASLGEADTLVSAMVGAIGLQPVLEAIGAGKKICLANKEPLVIGGRLVMEAARRAGVPIIPVDSEHSAIFQCLGEDEARFVERLIITASGGPFRNLAAPALATVSPAEALRHPNWQMGGKITIDSATLMNKGLEVIEAHWLFGVDFDRIRVVVHPQSIIHSLIEFQDGSILAQMGFPDMRLPIQYALSHPERWAASCRRTDLLTVGTLTFEAPRLDDFPCLGLAYAAGRQGGNQPGVMNAANEVAVEAFLAGRLGFTGIPRVIQATMDAVPFVPEVTLEGLLAADAQARREAAAIIARGDGARVAPVGVAP
ncbi:MAG: 1-deoxy-D-xylulose-5-phosphate reductoisomerase [Candidatus Riflebacteria bacterium]|nr:1-deoxy-D-xylulose-5-phosphate reductoisomerase [Candidatus Riflebacteria bacterium]